ncbi:hypothetical protein CHS0354_011845 [Potamilus streckersoni]|uniref:Uncharacterized protein n=1 Tax=Potamilus streckersoni TaxID=2493646 RepID=A0AAE0TF43_9BIVA|nr:hypothetical protein CHS0354_011845 [Potamilus streckersoni]
MSQNFFFKKKAFLEYRKIRQAQQRVNKTTQKLNALYGNIRPGKAIAQINSSHPQNTCLINPQSSNIYRGAATTNSPTIPNRKRKDLEQETTINQATQISGKSCINAHSYTQGHGQSHVSNNQHSLNRKAANETWKNPCHVTQDRIRPNQPNPRDTKNKSERKKRYARDNQIPGLSKTHTIEELKEIRQAIENFDLTHTNIHPSYENPSEFEEIRILPKGKQPLRGPPKGKSTESTVLPSICNTPTRHLKAN